MKYIVLLLVILAIGVEAKKKHHLRNKQDPWYELAQPPISKGCKYPFGKDCCHYHYQGKQTMQNSLCTNTFGAMQSQCSNQVDVASYEQFYNQVCPQMQNDAATYTCQMFAEDVIYYNGNFFMKQMPLQRQYLSIWLLNYPKAYFGMKQKCATF